MNNLKLHLRTILESNHQGPSRAIKIRNFIHLYQLELSDRQVREILSELNMEGYPIVTRTSQPMGIYWATSIDDIRDYSANLWSRIRKMIIRARKVDETGTMEFLKGQLSLFKTGEK